jgi:tellurite resistance protein TehA-like permease
MKTNYMLLGLCFLVLGFLLVMIFVVFVFLRFFLEPLQEQNFQFTYTLLIVSIGYCSPMGFLPDSIVHLCSIYVLLFFDFVYGAVFFAVCFYFYF